MGLICCLAVLPPPSTSAASFTWTLGSDVTDNAFSYADGTPGIVKDGSDLWVIYADGSQAGAPIRRYKGPDLDHLVRQTDAVKDSSFTQPHGDDVYWLMGGIWVDNGIWYSPVHVEFNYRDTDSGKTWFRKIGIATSNDKGATWHYWTDIITSNHSYNWDEGTSDYYNYGPGGQHIYVDTAGGYIYMYYSVAWATKDSSYIQWPTERVARSPISAKMDAGSWTKWYNGTWSEPGLGGKDSDINMVGTNEPHISYNTYLGKYIAIGSSWSYSGESIISTATSLELQDWTPLERFATNRMQWYHWTVDPSTFSMWTTGQSFRLYDAQSFFGNVDAKYMNVTLGTGTTTPYYFTPIYTPHSVRDFNAPWDWAFRTFAPYSDTYTQNFTGTLGGYYKAAGNGTIALTGNAMNVTSTDGSSVLAIDNNSPSVADGSITLKINPVSGGRTGVVFRYQSPTQWTGLLYDVGTGWIICDGAGHYKNIPTSAGMADGTTHTLNVEFRGTFYAINLDGNCIYYDSFSAAPTAAGKIGFRNWNYSETQYDDIVLRY